MCQKEIIGRKFVILLIVLLASFVGCDKTEEASSIEAKEVFF